MAHEFKRLGDVEIAEAISESANVLIEEEGNIKRVSKNNVVPNNVALKSDIPDAVINPSNAVVGQTIVVKAVDETGKPTEWECADMGGQSDWNQNDPEAKDYINNRPFYEVVQDIIWTAKQTITIDSNGRAYTERTEDWPPVDVPYIITFDDVKYTGTVWEDGDACIRTDFTTANGEYVQIYDGSNIAAPASLAGEHTIEIVYQILQIQSLDSKYLSFPAYGGTGKNSIVLNNARNTASGIYSHAEGQGTTASGQYSHAEGWGTTASGEYSHAEGFDTTASGPNSHAEGQGTTASRMHSHAEGFNTTASGNYSHAEGYYTTASSIYSHAEGCYTIASGQYSHIQGKYNIEDTTNKYAHIVGNGTSDSKRSNAHTLDWNGNAWYQGTVEGTAFIVTSSTSGSTKRFKITVDDSGTISAAEVTE